MISRADRTITRATRIQSRPARPIVWPRISELARSRHIAWRAKRAAAAAASCGDGCKPPLGRKDNSGEYARSVAARTEQRLASAQQTALVRNREGARRSANKQKCLLKTLESENQRLRAQMQLKQAQARLLLALLGMGEQLETLPEVDVLPCIPYHTVQ